MFIKEYVLYPVFEYYLGLKISDLEQQYDGHYSFEANDYYGEMVFNQENSVWEIMLDGKLITIIEGILIETFAPEKEPLVSVYYASLKKLKTKKLRPKSLRLVNNVMESLQDSILNQYMIIDKGISFDHFFVFNIDKTKQVIVLN